MTNPWALSLVAVACLLPACSKRNAEPGQWHTCSCAYLTDYDDRAFHKVEVCVPPSQQAPRSAAECVLKHQSGHFDDCKCEAPAAACDGSDPCRSLENAPGR